MIPMEGSVPYHVYWNARARGDKYTALASQYKSEGLRR